MGKRKETSGLGRSLQKDRFGGGYKQTKGDTFLHTSDLGDGYDWGRLNLQSVTEESSLNEFLATAQLAGTEFAAEKMNVMIVNADRPADILTEEQEQMIHTAQEENRQFLTVPRRPPWNESTTAEQLDLMERESFLTWRRQLAELQDKEHLVLTPFERNLDFWRQLWRVIERSDVIVQIVDARNPLLFRCTDLELYVQEVSENKVNVVLVNKADLLNLEQRSIWAKYFQSIGVQAIFWSAVEEAERLKQEKEAEDRDSEDDEGIDEDGSEDEDQNEKLMEENESTKTVDDNNEVEAESKLENTHETICANAHRCHAQNKDSHMERDIEQLNLSSEAALSKDCDMTQKCSHSRNSHIINNPDLVNGDQLLEFLKSLHNGPKVSEGITTVGLVGYPNVGKSSTINSIMQCKKVPVSATPGRTKHFQTLYVEPTLMLCDCPGLVMPTFVTTKADMVCSGILPIDQMRDYVPPVALVCQRIARRILEQTYGIILPQPKEGQDPNRAPTAHEFLTAYAFMRGFMTHKGVPDFPRSARCVLKDYVNGKLLYCYPPPGIDPEKFRVTAVVSVRKTQPLDHTQNKRMPKGSKPLNRSKALDEQFFEKSQPKIHPRGVRGPTGISTDGSSSTSGSQQSLVGKPWKRHGNRGKKEKARRLYSHHDAF